MRTVHHILTQDSRSQMRSHLHGWSVGGAKPDAGVVAITFTARKINPCGDPGGLLKERKP